MILRWFPEKIRILTLFYVLAVFLPLLFDSPYALNILVLLIIWIILTDSLNFVTGFAGQLSFGHASFVIIGAYAGAILMRDHNWSFWTAILIGGVFSTLSGLFLGILALRLRGDYLGMITLGFGEIIRIFAINWIKITNGPAGYANVPRPVILGHTFNSGQQYYFLILIILIITHFLFERLLLSRFGRACLAIRDDEIAANAMGVKPYTYKVWAFCLSCFTCGLVGVFYAGWITTVAPSAFNINDSIMLNVMNVLGGIGSIEGAFPGGIIVGLLPEALRPFTASLAISSLRLAFVGLVLILLMIIRPNGFFGTSIKRTYISLLPIKNFLLRQEKDDRKEITTKFVSAVDDKLLKSLINGIKQKA